MKRTKLKSLTKNLEIAKQEVSFADGDFYTGDCLLPSNVPHGFGKLSFLNDGTYGFAYILFL